MKSSHRRQRPADAAPRCGDICPAPGDASAGGRARCPASRTIGPRVDLITVKALLKPEALRRLEGTDYRFCRDPGCEVVYFDSAAASSFRRDDLVVRVGLKETEDPIPVCYCFDYTMADLRREIAARGDSAIPAAIAAQIQAGHCACELKNPKGSCCLGEVRSAVKRIRSALSK